MLRGGVFVHEFRMFHLQCFQLACQRIVRIIIQLRRIQVIIQMVVIIDFFFQGRIALPRLCNLQDTTSVA